jgi:threonine dehydrogenase-like Zn-dependent dehydrogenase
MKCILRPPAGRRGICDLCLAQSAENGQMEPGDTVAVWGCGPVAQFAIKSACMLGATAPFAAVPQSGRRMHQGGS